MNDLLSRLLRTASALEARVERGLEPAGLSLAKLGVLRHLRLAGGALPLGQLASRLSCVRSNVTQLVDRLEADGLVRRAPDPHDRRSVLAVLTDRGRECCLQGARAQAEAEAGILGTLAPEEREALARLLEKLGSA